MRISRGLNALLWSASTLVVASPPPGAAAAAAAAAAGPMISRSQPLLDIFNSSALNAYVDEYRTNYVLRPKRNSQRRIARLSKSRAEDGLFAGQDEEDVGVHCGGSGCSQDELLRRQEADSTETITITSTLVRTVSVAPAIATAIVISTVSQTLTFVNPALGTQTQVVTVTAAARERRRRVASAPQTALEMQRLVHVARPTVTLERMAAFDALETQLSRMGVKVKRQEDEEAEEEDSPAVTTTAEAVAEGQTVTITETSTVEVTTTVTVPGTVTITSTIFNTVFVTATVAPSATSTVFTTTTIQPQVTGGNNVPGGVIPPTGGGIIPENPSVLPPGEPVPSGTLLPPGAPSNPPLPSGTQVPPGETDLLPSGSPTRTGNQQSMQPPTSTPTESSNPDGGPVSPFPGSGLTSDQIAGIVLGAVFFVFLILLAIFLIRRYSKRKQRAQLAKDHQDMAGPLGAGGLGRTQSTHDRPTLGPSDSSSGGGPAGEGEVRIVIRPAPKRRTQSSGLFPLAGGPSRIPSGTSYDSGATRSQWPRPPGYSGQTYSFFIEESGATTPQDPNQWSVASEYGSGSAYTASGGAGGTGGNTQYNSYSNYSQDERNYSNDRDNSNSNNRNGGGAGASGAGGGEYLTVGRALSPWNPL